MLILFDYINQKINKIWTVFFNNIKKLMIQQMLFPQIYLIQVYNSKIWN